MSPGWLWTGAVVVWLEREELPVMSLLLQSSPFQGHEKRLVPWQWKRGKGLNSLPLRIRSGRTAIYHLFGWIRTAFPYFVSLIGMCLQAISVRKIYLEVFARRFAFKSGTDMRSTTFWYIGKLIQMLPLPVWFPLAEWIGWENLQEWKR